MTTGCDFDWYRAGINDSADYVLGVLQSGFDLSDIEHSRPKHGYAHAADLVRGQNRLCSVMWGGNTGGRVMIESSGANASPAASMIRSAWPEHYLLRADVAIDIDMPGAWDSMYTMATGLADKYSLSCKHIGDYHRAQNGRTVEVGSRKSPVMMRVYEKAAEQRIKNGYTHLSNDLVRVETEIKPAKADRRLLCSTLSPVELMGCAEFTTDAAQVLLGESVKRVTGLNRLKRPSDRDRALSYMVRQYGKHLDSLLEELGSWCEVGKHLGSLRSGDDE